MPLPCLAAHADGSLTLTLRVQPRASRTAIAGMHGDALKVQVTAPPVDAAANEAVVAVVAGLLGAPKSAIAIIRGGTARTKVVRIHGVSAAAAETAIARALA
jgi:uncharacterized protein (TIGR00251 family)